MLLQRTIIGPDFCLSWYGVYLEEELKTEIFVKELSM